MKYTFCGLLNLLKPFKTFTFIFAFTYLINTKSKDFESPTSCESECVNVEVILGKLNIIINQIIGWKYHSIYAVSFYAFGVPES